MRTRILQSVRSTVLRGMYPLFARYHEKKIAMFHHGRCGSTVIGKMLNDHPRLYWAGEPFHTSAIKQRVQNREIQFHEMIRWSQYEAGPRYYGFEIKYRQLSILGIQSQAFLEDLCALRFNYFIHLHRKNVLRQLISSLIGQQAGYWHLSVNSDPQQSTIHLSPDGLIPQLDSAIQAVRHFSDLLSTMNVLEINYEDHIMEDPRIAYERICAFVGVPVAMVQPRLQRINSQPLREVIRNFEDIADLLSGHPYEWMLYT